MGFSRFPTGRSGLRRVFFRGLLPVVALAASAAILGQELGHVDARDISAAMASVPVGAWALSLAATAASFLAVGMYDALFHAWLDTGVRMRRAARTGAAAIALAQTLGFGLVTGTLARWRALPEVSLSQAFAVTNYVSFSFMAALGTLSALALALVNPHMPGASVFAAVGVAAAVVAALLSFAPFGVLPVRMPPLRLMARLIVLTAIDTGFATLALWVLLPGEAQPAFGHLGAAFLLALGAGFISGTPGGIGPFEVCLVALLPDVPEPELIAAILAFRMVYYALPACIAILALARPKPARRDLPGRVPFSAVRRAEAGLTQLPGHRLVPVGDVLAVTADAGPVRVAIGDPICGEAFTPDRIAALSRSADRTSLWPALYKVGARSAAAARHSGWQVMSVGEESWVDPQVFRLDGPERRQLRRKVRQAEGAGIRIDASGRLPTRAMQAVADEWARRSGGERGFSMGRFEPGYLDGQRVFLAWQGPRLVAFATFHVSAREWTLDLMRSADDIPNGVMHALVARAIRDAARCGIARLSLAAMPLDAPKGPIAPLARRPEAAGLRRFKTSFAPRTETLYLAAPNRALLALAAASILISIRFPGRLPPSSIDGNDLVAEG